jgi:hypothetical protein
MFIGLYLERYVVVILCSYCYSSILGFLEDMYLSLSLNCLYVLQTQKPQLYNLYPILRQDFSLQ